MCLTFVILYALLAVSMPNVITITTSSYKSRVDLEFSKGGLFSIVIG